MRDCLPMLSEQPGDDLAVIHEALESAIDALENASQWLVANWAADTPRALAGAVPYLKIFGTVAGGWLLAKGALVAQARLEAGLGDARFNEAKIATARFYAEQYLPGAAALVPAVKAGTTVMAFDPDAF